MEKENDQKVPFESEKLLLKQTCQVQWIHPKLFNTCDEHIGWCFLVKQSKILEYWKLF
jgi:hypothetical protein